jgi:hypothetical protein
MKPSLILQLVLKEQNESFRRIPLDIQITNGNILLRSFRLYEVDWNTGIIKGLTFQEEYAHARENREPVFCYLRLDEIKELSAPELGLEYSDNEWLVKA